MAQYEMVAEKGGKEVFGEVLGVVLTGGDQMQFRKKQPWSL